MMISSGRLRSILCVVAVAVWIAVLSDQVAGLCQATIVLCSMIVLCDTCRNACELVTNMRRKGHITALPSPGQNCIAGKANGAPVLFNVRIDVEPDVGVSIHPACAIVDRPPKSDGKGQTVYRLDTHIARCTDMIADIGDANGARLALSRLDTPIRLTSEGMEATISYIGMITPALEAQSHKQMHGMMELTLPQLGEGVGIRYSQGASGSAASTCRVDVEACRSAGEAVAIYAVVRVDDQLAPIFIASTSDGCIWIFADDVPVDDPIGETPSNDSIYRVGKVEMQRTRGLQTAIYEHLVVLNDDLRRSVDSAKHCYLVGVASGHSLTIAAHGDGMRGWLSSPERGFTSYMRGAGNWATCIWLIASSALVISLC